jgi:hypothetical protein
MVRITGLPPTAAPGDTLRATAAVRASDGTAIQEAIVRFAATGDGRVLADSVATDSLGLAETGWVLGREPAQEIVARVDTLGAAAAVRVVPVLARLDVAPRDTLVTSLSDSLVLRVRAWDRDDVEIPVPATLTLKVLSETRAIAALPVVGDLMSAAVLRFTGPGEAVVAIASDSMVSPAVTVTVSSPEPIVAVIDGPTAVTEGDEVLIRGYRLDLVDLAAVSVDGIPTTILTQDSATLRFAVPQRQLPPCEGMARALVEIAGARVIEPLALEYRRPEALTIAVGDAVRLGTDSSQCLVLPGDTDAEYALLYFDTRSVVASETAPEVEGQIFQLFDLEIADWSTGAPASAGGALAAAGSPLGDSAHFASSRLAAATDTTVCDFWRHIIDVRTTPFHQGDTVLVNLDGTYACGRVARVYGTRFPLIVLDRDSLLNIPGRLGEVDAAMEVVMAHGVPVMMGALSPNFPESARGTGQLAMVIAAWDGGAPAFWSGTVMAFNAPGSTSGPVYLNWGVITHEMAHAWQDRHLQDLCETDGLCDGGPRGVWGGEGVADFLSVETGRRKNGAAIDANLGYFEYAEILPALWTSNGSILFGRGYGSSSWFLRDLVVRAVREGVPERDALQAVARGATEGWYGQFVNGPPRPGLVQRMSTLLGRSWDPVEALLTSGMSLAMDDLTDSQTYQNRAYLNVWENYPPMAMIGEDTTAAVAGAFYGSSFGYVRIRDGGRGGSYRFGVSVAGIEWIVGRVR